MNLRYANSRFEAEFSQDFQGDLAAVKNAGFKYDSSTGYPVWHTIKMPVLLKLRENRPASGITINPDAQEIFKLWLGAHEKNAEIKAAARQLDKERKKAAKDAAKEDEAIDCFGDKESIGPEDLPPMPERESAFKRPDPPKERCMICDDPLYFYELPDICIWCEKTA